MSYGYGGRPNPFDQRDDAPGGGGGGYGAPARGPPQASFGQGPRPGGGGGGRYNPPPAGGYNQGPVGGRGNYGSSNVEMSSLTQNAGSFGSGNPNAILDECRSIDKGVDQIEGNLQQLRMLQDRTLTEAESSNSSTTRQLDSLSSQTMAMYRELTERVRQVKSQREAQQPKNAPQVGRVDRRLKQAIQSFQQVDAAFRKKSQDQMARQYRIVRPDASESEVRAVVEDTPGGQQVFQQAMMQSGRQGQARAVLSAVQDRQAALEKIEQQMIELAQLFQDMDTLVVQQEVQVTQIEQKGEEVVENLDKGNDEIATAVVSAKRTRKNKWICLGIVVAILVVAAIIVVVYIMVNRASNGAKKRDVQARSLLFAGEPPVANVFAQSKIVVPAAAGAPLARFGAGGSKARAVARFVDTEGTGVHNPNAEVARAVAAAYAVGTDFTDDESVSLVERRMVRIGVPFVNNAGAEAQPQQKHRKRFVVADRPFVNNAGAEALPLQKHKKRFVVADKPFVNNAGAESLPLQKRYIIVDKPFDDNGDE